MKEIGISKEVKQFFRSLDDNEINNISKFYDECSIRCYRAFDDFDLSLIFCNRELYNDEFRDVFNNYSGFNYRRINACARNKWNYEKHGNINDKARFDQIVLELKRAIDNNQSSIGNAKVYRGVPISYFYDYGIKFLDDLKELEGKYLLDKGFVSTSLVENDCYYMKDNDLGLNYNIKIEYLIPEEFEDGVIISNFSYSPEQNEYLINSWNIAVVSNVSINENSAIITAIFIPKKVYDISYRYEVGVVR